MNMQAMMRQVQSLQKNMVKDKEEIDKMEFFGESSLVKVTMLGTKKITKVEINSKDSLDSDDIEMLQDMILLAVNDASDKVDSYTEEKMGKYGNSVPGLF